MGKRQFSDLITLIFITLFAYAGWTKLLDYHSFRDQLAAFDHISAFAGFLALAMPLTHLGLALLFVWRKMRVCALWISFGLLMSYSAYITVVLFSETNMPCACGGLFKFTSWSGQLAMNSLLVACAFFGIIFQPNISPTRRNFDH